MGKTRKIIVEFNTSQKIKNLKRIMQNVYRSNSDHLPDVANFRLGDKTFIPNQVEKAELHIITASGTEIQEFPKSSLSFYLGTGHPFTKVAMSSEDEGNYIVLPWNLGSRVGRDNLKNLNERLRPENIKELKYIICVNSSDNLNSLSLESSKDLSQSLTSLASLHLSDIAAEDETEDLLNKIADLEERLRARDNVVNQKQAQISSLTTQVNSLNTQVANLQTQVQIQSTIAPSYGGQSWTLTLPNYINGNIDSSSCNLSFGGSTATLTNWKTYASVNNVAGSVTIDVVNRRLTIGGSSCGSISAY
ncbi:hypothetical protein [Candidatus Tisiphia endosymbiont of Temnostethus pusillus]|uniref:hypothetical protein n=1 Tax=Candidatus Tisiphia endosymbiont of Temnostethus pusillus TaxID=3139335 RepID=UPI0035C892F7